MGAFYTDSNGNVFGGNGGSAGILGVCMGVSAGLAFLWAIYDGAVNENVSRSVEIADVVAAQICSVPGQLIEGVNPRSEAVQGVGEVVEWVPKIYCGVSAGVGAAAGGFVGEFGRGIYDGLSSESQKTAALTPPARIALRSGSALTTSFPKLGVAIPG
jgi:hypothetical protein